MNTMSMPAYVFPENITSPAQRHRFTSLWEHMRIWLEERQLKRRLYGMEPHLLRDMGFDPEQIYGAYLGMPAEIHGDRFRGFFPLTDYRRWRQ